MITEDAEFTVASRQWRTPVITELLLRPAGPRLRYQPGQYVLLGDPDAELVVRSYSIATAPRRDGLISLLVTRVPGGQLSTWIHDVLRPGDRVLLSGARFYPIKFSKTIASRWRATFATRPGSQHRLPIAAPCQHRY